MNVALLVRNFGWGGGAERYVRRLTEGLLGKEIGVTVVTRKGNVSLSKTFKKEGLRVQQIPGLNWDSVSSVLSFSWMSGRCAKSLKNSGQVDLVHSFERTVYQDIVRIGHGCHCEWLERRKRFVGKLKALSFSISPLHRLMLSIEKKQFARSRFIIANSKLGREEVISHYGIPANRVRVIYNGVDTQKFQPVTYEQKLELRERFKLTPSRPIVLFVGSGFWRKGLGFAVRALMHLKEIGALLVVVGAGDQRGFARMAEAAGVLEMLYFANERADVSQWYRLADAFILPSIYEPFSNACLEAMASGLPIVVPLNTGAAEVVQDGINGVLVADVADSVLMAQAIEKALHLDLSNLRRANKPILAKLTWEENVNQTVQLYREYLSEK